MGELNIIEQHDIQQPLWDNDFHLPLFEINYGVTEDAQILGLTKECKGEKSLVTERRIGRHVGEEAKFDGELVIT